MTTGELKKILKEKYTINSELCRRNYLFPDGDVLHLDRYNSHDDVKWWLQKEKGFSAEDSELENYGCIRMNFENEGFVALPKVSPTYIQYEKLYEAFDKFLRGCGTNNNHFQVLELSPERYLNPQDGYPASVFHYFPWSYTAEDYLLIITHFYATGHFVEDAELLKESLSKKEKI